jgi:hypothetical protein
MTQPVIPRPARGGDGRFLAAQKERPDLMEQIGAPVKQKTEAKEKPQFTPTKAKAQRQKQITAQRRGLLFDRAGFDLASSETPWRLVRSDLWALQQSFFYTHRELAQRLRALAFRYGNDHVLHPSERVSLALAVGSLRGAWEGQS